MIGGNDIIYPRRLSSEMLDFTLRMFRAFWPNAVMEDQDALSPQTIDEAIRNTLGGPECFMVYPDKSAYDSWVDVGLDPSNGDTMIYVLMGEDSTTFVVSDSLPKTPEMVAEIIQALDVNFPRRDR
jgi:hypothetical protein